GPLGSYKALPASFIFFFVVNGLYLYYVVLRIKPSASHMLGKRSTTEPQPQPHLFFFNYFSAVVGHNTFLSFFLY
ncbi:hypothetical protein V4Y02_23945, partial [Escherichia coli]